MSCSMRWWNVYSNRRRNSRPGKKKKKNKKKKIKIKKGNKASTKARIAESSTITLRKMQRQLVKLHEHADLMEAKMLMSRNV